jgi:hypothetical protein
MDNVELDYIAIDQRPDNPEVLEPTPVTDALARAYSDAFKWRYGRTPLGTHLLDGVDLVIDYGPNWE